MLYFTVAFVSDVDGRDVYKDKLRDEQSEKSQLPPPRKGIFIKYNQWS